MKVLYIDQITGISGDMILSMLVALNGNIKWQEFVNLLPVNKNIKNDCKIKKVEKNHITTTKVCIPEIENKITYTEFIELVKKSKFNLRIKEKVINVISLLAEVESKIHNVSIKKFHFHNYTDLLVELFGTFYFIERLNIEKIFSSPVKLSRGYVKTLHGIYPVPAPATIELIKGFPVEYIDISDETTTPTGVAILKSLNPEFSFPNIIIEKVGYAAGEKNLTYPNILRGILGKSVNRQLQGKYNYDIIFKLETNLDDFNPLFYEQLIEKLYFIGCYETFLTQTINKKSRPGVMLTVLLPEKILQPIIDTIFSYTSTTGVRIEQVSRIKLNREDKTFRTSFGKIRTKIITYPDTKKEIRPEYNDVKQISEKLNLPIQKLYTQIYSELNYKKLRNE